jgi:hypothetical protein
MLRDHCEAEQRNYDEIGRTSVISLLLARDAVTQAVKPERLAVPASFYGFAGTLSEVTDLLGAYRDAGVQPPGQ